MEKPNGDDFFKKLYDNDPDLIAGIKEGKGEDAERFYTWLMDAVLARLVVRHKVAYDMAEDLAGEIVLQIFEGLRHFDPGRAPLIAWINRIVGNRAIDEYRRQVAARKRRGQELYVYEIELIQFLHSRYPEYEDEILRRLGWWEEEPTEDKLILDYVFGNSLTEDEQNILLWTHAFGLGDAAERFGVTREVAKQRYLKAVRRLRRAFFKLRGSVAP